MKKIFYQFCDRVVKCKYKLWIAGIFLVIWVFWFSDFALAQSTPTDNSWSQLVLEIYLMMAIIVKFLSWIWVLLAKIAGMLMTNAAVTWDGLWLTEVLYGYHKFIQNLARLALVVMILKSIISNAVIDYKPEKIIDVIKNWMIASVGIYFIWWLIGIVISISNILFLAISDLGNNLIIQTNWDTMNQITFSIPNSITRDASRNNANDVTNQEATVDNNRNLIDSMCMLMNITSTETNPNNNSSIKFGSMLPSTSDLSGPLMYFGFGIFRFNSLAVDSAFNISLDKLTPFCKNTNIVPDEKQLLDIIWDQETISNVKNKLLSLMLIFLNIIIFSLALITFIVINFLRMVFIRTLMVFSPLIVLWWVFGKDVETIGKMAEDIWAWSVSSLMWLIFQPVVSIFWLSIALFFVNSIYASFTNFQTPEQKEMAWWSIFKTTNNTISFDQWSSVNIQGSFINDAVGGVWWWISYILMSIITLYIIWMIIKVSGNFSKAVGKHTDFIMKKASNVIFDNVKIWWASLWAITWAGGTSKDSLKKKLPDIITSRRESDVNRDYDVTKDWIQRMFGITTPDIAANTASWLSLKDGAIDWKDDNKMLWFMNKKDVQEKRAISWQLNKTKKQTIDYFKDIKKEIYEKHKGEKFEFKTAVKTQEAMEKWLKTWWLLFMHNAYGVDLEKDLGLTTDQIKKNPSSIDFKKLLEGKSQIGAFMNNMLTSDSFIESFWKEDTKFDATTWAFKDNDTKKAISDSNKKAASSISFDVPK